MDAELFWTSTQTTTGYNFRGRETGTGSQTSSFFVPFPLDTVTQLYAASSEGILAIGFSDYLTGVILAYLIQNGTMAEVPLWKRSANSAYNTNLVQCFGGFLLADEQANTVQFLDAQTGQTVWTHAGSFIDRDGSDQ